MLVLKRKRAKLIRLLRIILIISGENSDLKSRIWAYFQNNSIDKKIKKNSLLCFLYVHDILACSSTTWNNDKVSIVNGHLTCILSDYLTV